uniref:NurA domain-containing protein n=2 Tax=Staphylothermus marinus TaxID=2280 RepID=A0A7C4HA76_STAMA
MNLDQLHKVLLEIFNKLKNDYLETSSDYFTQTRSFVFNNFYSVKPLVSIDSSLKKTFLFIDAGFKIYELDVALIIPIQISGLFRDENGLLLSIDKLFDKPVVDTFIIYASRKRLGDEYVFSIDIKCLTDRTLLFETESDCIETSNDLNKLVAELVTFRKHRAPRFFSKITKYVEGLIEIAYGLKLREFLKKTYGYEPVVVYDGTLLRWFSIRRRGFNIDGLDIISEILKREAISVIDELMNVIGLSKTTKFTTIARSYGLFSSYSNTWTSSRGLYTDINIDGLKLVVEKLLEVLNKYSALDFIDETIKVFNRIVYDKHGVYVSRFPITSDFTNVFVADLYSKNQVIGLKSDNIIVNHIEANNINHRIHSIVPNLYIYRSKLIGEPPLGYMEIDGFIRYSRELAIVFENLFLKTMNYIDEPLLKPLIQAFSSTMRMRYGYR